jgi:hypothetical protein
VLSVTGSARTPLIFLDVDGPLIPFGPRPTGCARRTASESAALTDPNPLVARLDPADGPRLLSLQCELTWATSWLHDANDVIAPRLSLPSLPVVQWPETDETPAGTHWKTSGLVSYSAGRPFVWIDDEIADADRAWVSIHHQGDALLHRVDPGCGLTLADFSAIRDWLGQLRLA